MNKTERTAHASKMNALLTEARRIVATGKCPNCGSKFRRNNSLSGWFQCEQFGSEQFRARPTEPSCDFQTFTE